MNVMKTIKLLASISLDCSAGSCVCQKAIRESTIMMLVRLTTTWLCNVKFIND